MLNELYPALNAAEKTVEMNPLWWIGHQTLGRARLGLNPSLARLDLIQAWHDLKSDVLSTIWRNHLPFI